MERTLARNILAACVGLAAFVIGGWGSIHLLMRAIAVVDWANGSHGGGNSIAGWAWILLFIVMPACASILAASAATIVLDPSQWVGALALLFLYFVFPFLALGAVILLFSAISFLS